MLRNTWVLLSVALLGISGCLGAKSPPPTSPSPSLGSSSLSHNLTNSFKRTNVSLAPLKVVPFEGTSSGGGVSTICYDQGSGTKSVDVPSGTNLSVRVEVTYKPTSPTGSNTMRMMIYNGTAGSSLATQGPGPSPLKADIPPEKLKGVKTLRIVLQVCEGVSTSQPFQGWASFFEGAIPENYTAVKP